MCPTLTILMPIKDVNNHLILAINSIKRQTFKDFQCFILTRMLNEVEKSELDSIIYNDPRFQIHQLSLNGIAFALNYGLNITKSKYLARMDGDDISHPLRFEKQINFLEKNPDYILVGCRVQLIDNVGNILKSNFKFFEENEEIRKVLKYRMPLCHPAIIFRTKELILNNGYMYGNSAEDHELCIRIARNPNLKFKNLPDCLFSYRRHDNQLTNMQYAKKAYCNISGFMFTELMLTGDLFYGIGIFAYHPFLRKMRQFLKKYF
jgi:glycosyltransferase involved in cell wall biosynthesis